MKRKLLLEGEKKPLSNASSVMYHSAGDSKLG
jgi:hypothetical protein